MYQSLGGRDDPLEGGGHEFEALEPEAAFWVDAAIRVTLAD